MRLGERCDEIVRLINETLSDLGIDPADAPAAVPVPAPVPATLAPVPSPGVVSERRRRTPRTWPPPDRVVSGY
jgi:hypothetical protein